MQFSTPFLSGEISFSKDVLKKVYFPKVFFREDVSDLRDIRRDLSLSLSLVRPYRKSRVRYGDKETLAARRPAKILTENSRPKLIKLAELCCRGTFVAPAGRPAYTSSSNFLIVCAWITTTERSGQTARVSPAVRVSNPKLCLSTLCPHCVLAPYIANPLPD